MVSNVHAMSDAASAAFSKLVPCPAQGCIDGSIGGLDGCEICGGTGRVLRRSFKEALRSALNRLVRSCITGSFDVVRDGRTSRVFCVRFLQEAWSKRREERALEEAEQALLRAGYRAVRMPGLGHVRVYPETTGQAAPADETRPAFDHEQCVHNQEPKPETLAECEGALAAE